MLVCHGFYCTSVIASLKLIPLLLHRKLDFPLLREEHSNVHSFRNPMRSIVKSQRSPICIPLLKLQSLSVRYIVSSVVRLLAGFRIVVVGLLLIRERCVVVYSIHIILLWQKYQKYAKVGLWLSWVSKTAPISISMTEPVYSIHIILLWILYTASKLSIYFPILCLIFSIQWCFVQLSDFRNILVFVLLILLGIYFWLHWIRRSCYYSYSRWLFGKCILSFKILFDEL
mgnify:CR=1 FL=1